MRDVLSEESYKRDMTNTNIVKYISNVLMLVGAFLGLYALFNIYALRERLPVGLCPVNDNRPMLYAAIVLCCVSFILSFFEGKKGDKGSEKKT